MSNPIDYDADGDGFDWFIHFEDDTEEAVIFQDFELDPNDIIDNQKIELHFQI